MKYFFDTEFAAERWSIRLLSIGIVAEDGREYYAVTPDMFVESHPWLVENVVARCKADRSVAKTPDQIATEIKDFVGDDLWSQFWAYYGTFDWFAFCGIFGGMMSLPEGWPWTFKDLRIELDRIGLRAMKDEGRNDEHNALADAKWVLSAWRQHLSVI